MEAVHFSNECRRLHVVSLEIKMLQDDRERDTQRLIRETIRYVEEYGRVLTLCRWLSEGSGGEGGRAIYVPSEL
ncbi:hypothetical protein EVAR_102187_1 [Eumeta japonica]|uniref:Uncharacterized protein n=1 Tax=Eumeta variegata TaxID=151549 RepID=A0A4C2AEB6_EUMVA|nr:hypothetical protein EVAR_102187_1 [Eumeta japonica]